MKKLLAAIVLAALPGLCEAQLSNGPYVYSAPGGGGGTPSGSAGGDLAGTYPNPTIAPNAVALGTDTTGSYAAGDAEAGAATSGDSATSFFPAGQLEAARGGTGADLSAATSGKYPKANGAGAFAASTLAAGGVGSCINQVVTAANADAAPTCASVATTHAASLSGNGTKFVSGTGTYTSGNGLVIDAGGNVVDSGSTPAAGDITDVWSSTSGNVSALTAATGDSLDASAADTTKACKSGTSPPAACSVGECFIDTDAISAAQLLICSASNTWTTQGFTVLATTSGASNTSNTSQNFIAVSGKDTPNGTEHNDHTINFAGGSFRHLFCATGSTPGAGKSYAFHLRADSSNSALTCTIADSNSSCSDTTNSATGTRITIGITPSGTPTASAIRCTVRYLPGATS